ncbi:MAG: EAL domain-containing protein [Alphaproteobacteria bacterium]|nr:EAL domain-containing protein [Alphaproteobacteria bacterium]
MTADFQYIVAPKGEVLFREDDEGDCAYIIETGLVQISVERGGKFVSVATLGRGEIVGEMAIIAAGRRSATAVALEECKLQRIEAEQFKSRLGTMDPVMRMVIEVILSRFRTTLKRIEDAPPELRKIALAPQPHTAEAMKNLRLESEITIAVKNDQFVPYYQPIVDLQSGKLAGFEALTRWVHPERGLISPDDFIPIAEQSDLITQITTLCLKNVCADMHELRKACLHNVEHVDPVFVGINVTPRDLDRPSFLADLQTMLVEHGLSTDMLKLELTESSVMTNLERAGMVLRKLRQLGFGVAIDDFGTGYSSMSYLTHLPISTLKIDRCFVELMEDSSRNRKIVQTILRLADELNIPVVAEGVSTKSAEAFLAGHLCAYGQGYLYSEPVPLEAAVEMAREWPNASGQTEQQTAAASANIARAAS